MKRLLSTVFFLVFLFPLFSQVTFDKGYFVNNSGQRIECLIKNIDWEENPYEFTYILSEGAEKQLATLEEIQEFGIYDWSKYVRRTVEIDQSKVADHSKATFGRKPRFKEETVFLNELVDGFAKLYSYNKNNIEWFFFSVDTTYSTQLVYKEYLTEKNKEFKLGVNNYFKQQLSNSLKCDAIPSKRIASLHYRKKDLVELFINYNQCLSHEFKVVRKTKKQNKDIINLSPRLGISSTSFSLENDSPGVLDANFETHSRLRIGLELELILPFNRNKWSIIIEPTFLSAYEAQKEGNLGPSHGNREITSKVKINTTEVPIGLRHYFFLNSDWSIYINAVNTIEFMREKEITHIPFWTSGTYTPGKFQRTTMNFSFGTGVKFSDRFSLEVRHVRYSDFLSSTSSGWHYIHRSNFFILGYNIL